MPRSEGRLEIKLGFPGETGIDRIYAVYGVPTILVVSWRLCGLVLSTGRPFITNYDV